MMSYNPSQKKLKKGRNLRKAKKRVRLAQPQGL
jgi:hypothetical protein